MFNWEITVMPKPSPDDTFLYIFKVYYHLLLPAASTTEYKQQTF